MRIPQTVMATAAGVATLVGVSVTGCSSQPKSTTPTSGSGAPTHAPILDYTQLLIKASDINAPDAFTAGPATKDPNGQKGALITFTDQDHSHTIIDTIQILPDAEGNAMVTLEFEGPSFALAPPEFVTEVGQKQDDAVKKGLGG